MDRLQILRDHLQAMDALPYKLLLFTHVLLAIFAVVLNFSYVVWIVRGERRPEALTFALEGIKWIDGRTSPTRVTSPWRRRVH